MPGSLSADHVILDAARQICVDEGIDGLSMRKLAGRLGVTAPALYRHYRNKQALVQALVDEANRVFRGYLTGALHGDNLGHRASRIMNAYLDFALDNPKLYDLLFHSKGRTDLDRLPDEQNSPNFRLLVDEIAKGIELGDLCRAEPVEVAISLWSMAHGLIGLYRNGRFGSDPAKFRAVYAQSMEHLYKGIAA